MRKFTTIAALLLSGGIFAGCATTTAGEPIPQAQKGAVETTAPKAAGKAASTCDRAREAFLTGSQADIDAALAALKADVTADGTAREYADYYLNRDAGQPDMREMDMGLIRMYCGL